MLQWNSLKYHYNHLIIRKLFSNNRPLRTKEIHDAGESSTFYCMVDDVQSELCVGSICCNCVIWLSSWVDGNSNCDIYRGNLVIFHCLPDSHDFSRNARNVNDWKIFAYFFGKNLVSPNSEAFLWLIRK